MQALQDAFTGRNKLSALVTQYGFPTIVTSIFNDLKAQFAESSRRPRCKNLSVAPLETP